MRKLALIFAPILMLLGAPVAAAATTLVGNSTIQAINDGGTGTSEAFGYTAVANGTADHISVYLRSTSGVRVGLYANSTQICGETQCAKPGARLATGIASSNTVGWVSVPLSANVPVNSGTRYWLVIAARTSTTTITYRDIGSSGGSLDYSGAGLADPYSISVQWNSNPASVYATGTTTAGSPVNTAKPTITGTAQSGSTLTADTGTWTGTTPISY